MKVSFVTPSYNTAAWLPHAVKSCLEQTHKDIEVVIVDDASTDTTGMYLDWLESQNDKRVKIIRNKENKGRSASRNIGNKAASGDVICVMDSDDLSVLNRAEMTLKKMKIADVVFGSAVVMDALGNASREIIAQPLDIEVALKKRENGIVHSSLAYTKEIALKYPYKSGKICALGLDDWEMQVRMMKDGVKFGMIPDVICAYRVLGSGISQTRDPKEVARVKAEILGGK